MDALIILFVGYVIIQGIVSGGSDAGKKPSKYRRKKKSSFWNDASTYSEYDTWSRSHGDKNTL